MNAYSAKNSNNGYKTAIFHPTYEGVHGVLADIHLYAFAADGQLVDSQPVLRGRATLALAADKLSGLRVVLSTPFDDDGEADLTLQAARLHAIFETRVDLADGQSSCELPPVPESVWRWWLVHSLWNKLHRAEQARAPCWRDYWRNIQ